jgi:hypothetical protein
MNTSTYQWRRFFLAALRDINGESDLDRLIVAEDAVFERLWELEAATGTEQERLALENTLQDLRLLRSNSYHLRT